MTTVADRSHSPAERRRDLLSALASRVGAVLRRVGGESYAERRGRIERTGSAGLI